MEQCPHCRSNSLYFDDVTSAALSINRAISGGGIGRLVLATGGHIWGMLAGEKTASTHHLTCRTCSELALQCRECKKIWAIKRRILSGWSAKCPACNTRNIISD